MAPRTPAGPCLLPGRSAAGEADGGTGPLRGPAGPPGAEGPETRVGMWAPRPSEAGKGSGPRGRSVGARGLREPQVRHASCRPTAPPGGGAIPPPSRLRPAHRPRPTGGRPRDVRTRPFPRFRRAPRDFRRELRELALPRPAAPRAVRVSGRRGRPAGPAVAAAAEAGPGFRADPAGSGERLPGLGPRGAGAGPPGTPAGRAGRGRQDCGRPVRAVPCSRGGPEDLLPQERGSSESRVPEPSLEVRVTGASAFPADTACACPAGAGQAPAPLTPRVRPACAGHRSRQNRPGRCTSRCAEMDSLGAGPQARPRAEPCCPGVGHTAPPVGTSGPQRPSAPSRPVPVPW